MAKVASSARLACREAFLEASVPVDVGDAELDDVIRNLRRTLKAPANTVGEESDLMVRALRHVYELLLRKADVSGLDADQIGSLMWDFLCGAVSSTTAADKCPAVTANEDVWADVITLLLATPAKVRMVIRNPFFARRAVVFYLVLLALSAAGVAFQFEMSGQAKVYSLMAASTLFVLADVWRRYGWDLFAVLRSDLDKPTPQLSKAGKQMDELSVSSASSRLRAENNELKAKLEQLGGLGDDRGLPATVPDGAPPLPAPCFGPGVGLSGDYSAPEPSVLVRSLQSLAQGPKDGPMLIGESPSLADEPALMSVGTTVRLRNFAKQPLLNGSLAKVTDVDPKGIYVRLLDGSQLAALGERFWTVVDEAQLPEEECHLLTQPAHHEPGQMSSDTYAPLAPASHEALKAEARKIKELLVKWHSKSSVVGTWFKGFWIEVCKISLSPTMGTLLSAHGYRGSVDSTIPKFEELKRTLADVESSGAPVGLLNKSMFNEAEAWSYEDEVAAWSDQLPPDFKRAAPEMYRTILSNGYSSLRSFINEYFPLKERSGNQEYIELFNICTSIDFLLKGKTSAMEVAATLVESDTAEIRLCRLSSWLHFKRTGDRIAAESLLAIKPPGSMMDIAPAWKVAEASLYSKFEHQRMDRGKPPKQHQGGYEPKGGKGKPPKGGGKGKKGKPPAGGAVQS